MSSPSTTTTKSPTAAEDIMMMNDMDIPVGLINSKKLLTEAQYTLCENLARLGQEHLFSEAFDAMPPANKRKLAQQLQDLDEEYGGGGSGSGSGNVGGLVWYIRNARVLLENSRLGVNPLKGWTPTLPTGQAFDFSSPEYEATEALGTQQLGAVGFVLVAGGLGERLGFNNIKLSLPTEMTTETCYLQHYIEYILAVQADHHNGNSSGKQLPLCIMTSGDTHKKTVALLQERHYFGMDQSQITIVQQGQGVPALCDNRGKFVLAPGDPSQLVVKPHGHGDVHKLLYTHGVARRWHNELGIAWLVLFQDTNGLAFHTLPLMLGVSARMNLIMNSLAVPRKAKQAIGGIARLVNDSTGEVKYVCMNMFVCVCANVRMFLCCWL
jgi:UDP-sugar pyrophosphorylase